MKFATYAALMTAASCTDLKNVSAEERNRLNTEWFIDGARGFYEGYYKSFYKKTAMPDGMEKCLDSQTVDNIYTFQSLAMNPFDAAANAFDV